MLEDKVRLVTVQRGILTEWCTSTYAATFAANQAHQRKARLAQAAFLEIKTVTDSLLTALDINSEPTGPTLEAFGHVRLRCAALPELFSIKSKVRPSPLDHRHVFTVFVAKAAFSSHDS